MAYWPLFHFIMKQDKLKLLFKSRNLSTYVTDRSKINGRYEIEEGWRADLFDGINDDRVNLFKEGIVGGQHPKSAYDIQMLNANSI